MFRETSLGRTFQDKVPDLSGFRLPYYRENGSRLRALLPLPQPHNERGGERNRPSLILILPSNHSEALKRSPLRSKRCPTEGVLDLPRQAEMRWESLLHRRPEITVPRKDRPFPTAAFLFELAPVQNDLNHAPHGFPPQMA